MSKSPFEIYEESYFEIFDPADARIVALFTDESDAREYLHWRNGRRAMEGYRKDGYVP